MTAVAMLSTLLAVVAPPFTAQAVGTVLFQNGFHNRTVDGTGTVTKPAPASGTNQACLTATGNSATLPLLSCSGTTDAQGAGKLRLTANAANEVGAVFGATSFPSSNGLDVTFKSYQWNGTDRGADGMTFVLAAVNPANTVPPAAIGPSGGSLGYSAYGSVNGLTNAYLGVGLDVYGNFSSPTYQGSGCTNPSTINAQVAGAVVIRGPGTARVGYCGLNTTNDGTAGSKVALRALGREASMVPVQVLVNPTSSSFTSTTGVSVSAGTYKVVVTPVGQAARTLTGALPAAPATLYPATTWTNANGVPKQLAFGFVGSTGSVTDTHEIDDVKVLTFDPVPQLDVSTTSYVAANPALGTPVNYAVTPSVQVGSSETQPISVTQTTPAGVVPVGAYGTGWTCAAPIGRAVTCTTTGSSFASGTTLPVINVVGIVTGSGMTAATVQNSSVTTVSSADGNPGTDIVTTAGTVPTGPTGLSVTPAIGTVTAGGAVTVTGSNITAATAIEIGTTTEQEAGTPVVLLPCQGGATSGCFTVSGSSLVITSMPARATSAAVSVTVVTRGIANAAAYTYADKPATIASPTATAGLASATLAWVVPAENGSAVTGYVVTPYLGGVAQTVRNFDAGATTRVISGLTAGGNYTFRVAAVNAYGTSTVSALSNSVTPYSVATAPTITSVRAGTSSVVLNWNAAASNGGSAVTGYVVTPYIGSVAQTPQSFTGTALTQTATGLTPGTAYTFTVAASLTTGTSTLYRINAGGPLVNATDGGPNWVADSASDSTLRTSGSLTSSDAGTVAFDSTVPAGTPTALFVTQRYDPGSKGNSDEMKWAFPVTSGANVKVRLYFANRYTGTGTVGDRVFDVAIDGTPALTNFDVVAAAGEDQTATMREFPVTSDGTINIDFGHEVENPLISAIEIIQVGLPSTGPPSARSSAATPNQPPTLTFAAPPAGEVGAVYSTQLTVNNGTSPLVWSISAGSLPAGLTLSANGLLSGTPTASGSFPVTVRVVDASGVTATKEVTLLIAAAPVVTFTPVAGEVTVPYSHQPTVTGGTGANRWAITGGSLPAGLTIAPATGLISGTPTASGSFSVTVSVTDDFGQVASKTGSIVIAALPTITSSAPAAGQVGLAYSTTFTVAGGSTPLVWSITAGNVPSGLSLDTSTGVLSGTPTTISSSSFTVLVTDSFGKTATKAVTLVVNPGPIVITKSANVSSVAPGGIVAYTIAITNSSSTAFTGVNLTDPMVGVLDDAVYNGPGVASTGTVSYGSSTLSWTGSLAANSTATITYSVTVNDPGTGNRVLSNTVTSTTLGTNCPTNGVDPRCAATVTVSGLTITKTADVATATPGSVVRFTVLATNTGKTAYTGATFTDTLAGVLDDATYDGDATASAGSVAYANPALTWTGDLAVDASVTISYTVTVANRDLGDRTLTGTVVSPTAGSSCPSGNPAASCSVTVTVLVPALAISNVAGSGTATPGATVGYTQTLSNTGQTAYTGISVNIALSGALDDATWANNAVASSGTLVYNVVPGTLVWTGSLAIGAAVTITESVVVRNPDPGDKAVTVVTTSTAAGSTCPIGTSNSACIATVSVLVPALTISKTADVSTTTPGSVVRYTVTVTNTGQTAYTGASFSDPLAAMLDDAAYNANVAATSGTASYAGSTVSWTGDLAVAATATITYAVTVANPDPGNKTLTGTVTSTTPFNNCAAGSVDTRCTNTVTVLVPGLTVSTVAGSATTTPGSVVTYTTTVTNTGQTTYPGAVVTLGFAGVADNATYNDDAISSTGSVAIVGPDVVTWTLTLAPGASATTVGSFTVNNPVTGDKAMTATANSAAAGSTCPTGMTAPPCSATVTVLIPGLTITKTVNASTVSPGGSVTYTILVANTGETTYPAASFDDSLASVLTDAVYAGGATATVGTVGYSGSTLSWTGALVPGATAIISYAVTVRDPDPGDKRMTNTVVSSAAGSNCAAASTDTRCTAVVNVLVPRLTITKTANVSTTVPGGVVGYTITVTNSGATAYTGAAFSDPLTSPGVLDDATYNGNAAANSGSVTLTGTTLGWVGDLAVGASATVTYSITVRTAVGGNNLVSNTVTSTTVGNNCTATSTDTRCTVIVPVARLDLLQTATETTATPGSVIHLTAVYTNTGEVPYTGISVTSPRADTADDTVPTGDQVASSGALVRTDSALTWTGSIPVGGSVTITRTLTVKNPDPGNKIVTATLNSSAAGNNCPTGTIDPRCKFTTTVVVPGLTIAKTAGATAVVPGGVSSYTITITNSGQTAYVGATVTDNLVGVLDDATYVGNAVTTIGALSYSSPVLTWTGNLAVGQTATVTYSVTVKNPDPGDKVMVNPVSSSDVGSTCPPASGSTACSVTVAVVTPALTIEQSSDQPNGTLGTKITYTVKVTNSGQTAYPAASFTESLTNVIDNATYSTAVTATVGTATYNGTTKLLSWSGALAVGQVSTISYAVTITSGGTGNETMVGTIVSTTTGSNCASGSTDSRCTETVVVVNDTTVTFTKTANVEYATAGTKVTYTIKAKNAGFLGLGIGFDDSLVGVLDDATYNNDLTYSIGMASYNSTNHNINWTIGLLSGSGTATITYSVTVKSGEPTGDQILTNAVVGSAGMASQNCGSGSTDPRCTSTVPVARLTIAQQYADTTTTPGSLVRLNATFTNTGKYAYEGITISSPSVGTVDDAIPTGDQTASSGTLVLSPTAITWTGNIPIGATITITGTLTVKNPDPGDRLITGTLVTNAPGSNCAGTSTDPVCTANLPVKVPGLTITKTANVAFVVPGQTASYTITVNNNGETPYDGASFTDSLAGVLDDAAYSGGATASTGAVTLTSGVLSWTGNLAVGAVATISYSVTANSLATGDKSMINAVSSTAVGSTCPPASGNAACFSSVDVRTPALTTVLTADKTAALPGDVVGYTVTVTNNGQTAFAGANVTVPLAGLVDDAVYAGGASATAGSVVLSGQSLVWTGPLAIGAGVTITYAVTVRNPVPGDRLLTQTLTSTSQGAICPAAGTDPRCSSSIPISTLQLTNSVDVTTVKPTGVVRYTGTFTNTGQVPYVGITVVSNYAAALDDALYNGDAATSSGSVLVVVGSGQIVWTGDIAIGQTVTVTGSVTVRNPDPGDKVLTTVLSTTAPGSNCAAGSVDPVCQTTVTVLTPALSISKVANRTTVSPGESVGYTITASNTGQTAYTAATLTDLLEGGSPGTGDGDISGTPTATRGVLVVRSDGLTWTGDLAVGQAVTISYTVLIANPDLGDKVLVNEVTSNELGSTCPDGGSAAACRTEVTVLVPALDIVVSSSTTTTTPGSTVSYTIVVRNAGETPYLGASVTAGLAGVANDGVYAGNAASTLGGSFSYTAPNLTWTGDLAVGAATTITYSVAVANPDLGNRLLSTSVSSLTAGSTCTAGSPCLNVVTVLIPGLAVSTTADVATATPGDRVTFTITVQNTGQTPYVGTAVSTDLTRILDDATFDGLATSNSGSMSYAAPGLTWTGSLAVGATAVITYAVIVRSPDPGNKSMLTTVVADAPGSTCPTVGAAPTCTATVTVLVPGLTINKSASVATITPGGTVGYTVNITNSGQTPYSGAVVSDSLSGLLTDATYDNNAVVIGGGLLSYTGSTLRWTGDLLIGATATITYSVTVLNPDPGDKRMTNTVVSFDPGSTCPVGNSLPACTSLVRVLVPALDITKTGDRTTVVAGGMVAYTITVKNTGETDYAPATFTDSLTDVLDDATYTGGAVANTGTVAYTNDTLSWSGPLLRGQTAAITYSVTTKFPALGNRSLLNQVESTSAGATCPAGSTDPVCRTTIAVTRPALTITKSADLTRVVAGGKVVYSIQATNTGESPYAAATFTDSLAGVLDDAVYAGNATASSGTLTYAAGTLGWTGGLGTGESVLITYSVTTSVVNGGNALLSNEVSSTAVGSTCLGVGGPSCVSTVPIDTQVLILSNLTPSFTLTGLPRSTVSRDNAVGMTVTTNSGGGYVVSVRAAAAALKGSPTNPDTIPVGNLKVRDSSREQFTPMSTSPFVVHTKNGPSGPSGDAVSNDYQVDIPFVASDTYSTTLEYIVATQ